MIERDATRLISSRNILVLRPANPCQFLVTGQRALTVSTVIMKAGRRTRPELVSGSIGPMVAAHWEGG